MRLPRIHDPVHASADMPEPPTGAVTFLFTDIQGSTRLVKQLRERYGEVLRDHQRLLREAFETYGGYEVDTQGDSFFVAFASARDAVLAAVAGQHALLSHSWPDGVEIKVRMGLHTGQAAAHDGRYTGLAVHRAARIGGAGHGGQILVSQATQTLLEDEEEDLGFSLRDLGEQRLKDLDRPVRLYQADAAGLPTSFPPVRSDAALGQVGDDARRPPAWRRRLGVAPVAAALFLGAAVATILVLDRGSGGGLGTVQANHVGVIDPQTNEIVDEIPVGIGPGPIAAGAGSIWVGNVQDRNLTRIDPAERTAAGTISLDERTPTGVAAGLGAVWVAHGLRGEVSRVDPQFGRVTGTTEVAGSAFGSPNGAVAVGSGSVWAVFSDSTLARLDPAGRVVASTLAGSQPAGVVAPGISVWVANSGDSTVQRFNAQTFREAPLQTFNVGTQPKGIIFADGAIWVANSGDATVTRIDPASGATSSIAVGEGPTGLASIPGTVWVASSTARTVSRIDTGTNEVVATIEIGDAPSGIAAAGGFLWVAVQAP
jgi:YVTN family beta-propeller protein